MSIDESYRLVSFITAKEVSGEISSTQFNLLSPIAQLSLIHDRLKPEYDEKGILVKGFGVNDKFREDLRPLLKNPQTIAVAAGIAAYPSDYLYMDSITDSTGKPITEATADEIAILNQSQIKPPSVGSPKYVMHQNGFNIYPTSLTSIKLAYLRKPLTPFWNSNPVNDRDVYSSSGSQDFETGILTHLEICMRILQAVGVNLNLEQVIAYSQLEQHKGS